MTYNVFGGTLSLTQSINQLLAYVSRSQCCCSNRRDGKVSSWAWPAAVSSERQYSARENGDSELDQRRRAPVSDDGDDGMLGRTRARQAVLRHVCRPDLQTHRRQVCTSRTLLTYDVASVFPSCPWPFLYRACLQTGDEREYLFLSHSQWFIPIPGPKFLTTFPFSPAPIPVDIWKTSGHTAFLGVYE